MTRKSYLILVVVLFAMCSYLGLYNLGGVSFWDDEAYTAKMARSYLKYGYFAAWDGTNLYTYRNGGLIRNDLTANPQPMDVWMCAAAFKLFGESNFSARILFCLSGLAAFWLFFLILEQEFRDRWWLKTWIILVFAFSITYLLNLRQARYYSSILFFSLWAFYFYLRTLDRKAWYDFLMVGVGAALAFFAHPSMTASFLVALGVAHLIFYPKVWGRREWLWCLGGIVLLFALTLPDAIGRTIWIRHDFDVIYNQPPLIRFFIKLWRNLRDLNSMHAYPWTLFLVTIVLIWKQRPKDEVFRKIRFWFTFAAINCIGIVASGPQPVNGPAFSDVRYLLMTVVFLFVLLGWTFYILHQYSRVVTWVLFGVFVTSSALSYVPPGWAKPYSVFKWTLPGLIYEIHNDYPTAYSETLKYINDNIPAGSTIFAHPEYTMVPFLFYTKDKYQYVGGLNRYTHLDRSVVTRLSPKFYIEEAYPDWVILVGFPEDSMSIINTVFSVPHLEGNKWVEYGYDYITTIPVYWDQTQRPELFSHNFGPVKINKDTIKQVYIFKRQTVSIN